MMILSVSSGDCTEWNLVVILLECHLVIILCVSSGYYIVYECHLVIILFMSIVVILLVLGVI